MSYLISMDWVKEHLSDTNVVVVDCRFTLGQPEAGYQNYQLDHLPGAVYFDLEKDLSGAKSQHGGRHPLPNIEQLVSKLGRAGIDETKRVVAYDDQGGAMASRFWWLLQYLGHKNVSIINGGYSEWKSIGYPVTDEVPHPQTTEFIPHIQENMVVDINMVKQVKDQPNTILIDSRDDKRYKGLEETIDPVAGHIPGAINSFWKGVLNNNGTWKSPEELRDWFSKVDRNKEIIVYCGSGVTACPNILGLQEAGYTNVKLYPGSWSDWCSYPENPIGKEE